MLIPESDVQGSASSAAVQNVGGLLQLKATAAPSPISAKQQQHVVNFSIQPPTYGNRKPAVVICILDTSGSMQEAASMGQQDDKAAAAESQLFSRLDLVKHSVNAVMGILEPTDYLALVTFSTQGQKHLAPTAMTESNKKKAHEKLMALQPSGQTNVWDGLRLGLECATQDAVCRDKNVVLLLLTDGEPNVNPPRGIVPTLKRQIEQEAQMNFSIHAFGFGYSLDSDLLNEIAQEGNGAYAYIPDCSMVGTVFVNHISNMLATVSRVAKLRVRPASPDTKILRVMGYPEDQQPKASDHDGSIELNVGLVQYGQSRDIVLLVQGDPQHTAGNPMLTATLQYDDGTSLVELAETTVGIDSLDTQNSEEARKDMAYQFARVYLIEKIREAMKIAQNDLPAAQRIIKDMVKVLQSLPDKSDRLDAIIRDVQSAKESEAQVNKSFEKREWYMKWGRHFLPSLVRAHFLQQCNNFKDPGVQKYGGKLFTELQTKADDLFCKLPPPKPSLQPRTTYTYSSTGQAQANPAPKAPVNMSRFYQASGGCFHGDSRVLMADGSSRLVKNIRAKDVLAGQARVVCVVQIAIQGGVTDLVSLKGTDGGELMITPYHPVRAANGEWKFPCDLAAPQPVSCDYVYNFVLDQGHVMIINGIECVTLGHDFDDSDVVKHPFFGTSKVLKNLQQMKGWESGLVYCANLTAVRDADTGMISEWISA